MVIYLSSTTSFSFSCWNLKLTPPQLAPLNADKLNSKALLKELWEFLPLNVAREKSSYHISATCVCNLILSVVPQSYTSLFCCLILIQASWYGRVPFSNLFCYASWGSVHWTQYNPAKNVTHTVHCTNNSSCNTDYPNDQKQGWRESAWGAYPVVRRQPTPLLCQMDTLTWKYIHGKRQPQQIKFHWGLQVSSTSWFLVVKTYTYIILLTTVNNSILFMYM